MYSKDEIVTPTTGKNWKDQLKLEKAKEPGINAMPKRLQKAKHRESQLKKRAEAYMQLIAQTESQKTTPNSQLSISTRGFGFLTQKCYNEVIMCQSPLPFGVKVYSMFRGTLGQADYVLRLALQDGGTTIPPHPVPADIYQFQSFETNIAALTRNFAPIIEALDALCRFTHDNGTFVPFVPESHLAITHDGEVEGYAPSPHSVTLSNLRATVVCLADINNPQLFRAYFHPNNAIPGALWDANDVLLNPDQIILPGYTSATLRMDLSGLKAWADSFKEKQFKEATWPNFLASLILFINLEIPLTLEIIDQLLSLPFLLRHLMPLFIKSYHRSSFHSFLSNIMASSQGNK